MELELLMRDGICTEVTNRTGLIMLYDNPMEMTSRAYYLVGGHWPHLPLPQHLTKLLAGWGDPTSGCRLGRHTRSAAGQAGWPPRL